MSFWSGRTVLITGHTGFKGSWLSIWLRELGAEVVGYALEPPTQPSMFELCALNDHVDSNIGDINDGEAFNALVERIQPEIIFHLAAEPLVRASYETPATTFSTNVMGTVNVLETARRTASVRAVVNVTSDKCYENIRNIKAHTEDDPMGGADPYSASKGCAELVAAAYASSFSLPIASVRAGNVVGGGDWAVDRIVPDCIKALQTGMSIKIRNPRSTRPWQHVLDPLNGYLLVGENLLRGGSEWSGGWNFGPTSDQAVSVSQVVEEVIARWGSGTWESVENEAAPAEACFLALDSSKAHSELGWSPRLDWSTALAWTVSWSRTALAQVSPAALYKHTSTQIKDYEQLMSGERVASKA